MHGASLGVRAEEDEPVTPMDPGNWKKTAEGFVGPGSQAGTSEKEDFRMDPEHPDGQTGPEWKVKIHG